MAFAQIKAVEYSTCVGRTSTGCVASTGCLPTMAEEEVLIIGKKLSKYSTDSDDVRCF